MLAPIILFVYNRLDHTTKTIEALQKNAFAKDSELFVFCDGPKVSCTSEQKERVLEVQRYARTIKGFKNVSVQSRDTNIGLANSVIKGVTEIINKYGKVIVLEDDIVTQPLFLRFMNDALEYYEDDERIFSIGAMSDEIDIPSSYTDGVYVFPRVCSWGWATWNDRWNTNNWDINSYSIFTNPSQREIRNLCRGGRDLWPMLQAQAEGKIDSWAVRWQYNLAFQNKLCLYPVDSFVSNIGLDGTGVHCGNSDTGIAPSRKLYDKNDYDICLVKNIRENKTISRNRRQFYERFQSRQSFVIKIKVFVYNILKKLRMIS